MAKLHQLNVRFDSPEDRLVLSVRSDDDSEIRLWITRRYTGLLLKILGKLAERNLDPGSGQSATVHDAIKSFQQDAILAGADFTSDYLDDASSHPFGKAPVLVSKIQYRHLDTGNVALLLGLPDGQDISLNLDRNLMIILIKLLQKGAAKAEWELQATAEVTLYEAASSFH